MSDRQAPAAATRSLGRLTGWLLRRHWWRHGFMSLDTMGPLTRRAWKWASRDL